MLEKVRSREKRTKRTVVATKTVMTMTKRYMSRVDATNAMADHWMADLDVLAYKRIDQRTIKCPPSIV
jgi:hypothetical protein